jgi:K+ transporter
VEAVNPWHAVRFLAVNKLHGFMVLGAVFFMVMLTWSKGRRILDEQLHQIMPPLHQFIVDLAGNPPQKSTTRPFS